MEKRCKSCGSDIWKLVAKNECKRCYPITNKIKAIESWEYRKPESWLKISGFDQTVLKSLNENEFEKVKRELITQFESRIYLYKRYFTKSEDSMSLEILLNNFSQLLSNSDKDREWLFHGYADIIDKELDNKSINFICKQLLWILINRRFKLDNVRIHQAISS